MIKRLLALGVLLMPLLGWSQSCNFWHVISFADGKKGCLTDYPLSQQKPVGYGSTVEKLASAMGLYAVAATVGRAESCPLVVGAAAASFAVTSPVLTQNREDAALASCRTGLPGNAPKDCTCALIVSDAVSAVTKDEFEARFLPPDALVARASKAPVPVAANTVPPAPKAQAAPVVVAAPAPAQASPPVPAPPDPAIARNEALLASLQKRLAELEAMRAVPPPAPAPVVVAAPAPAPVVVPPPPPKPQVPRMSARALVIGNSRYSSFGALANPGRDARAIAAKLESFGIAVDLVIDAQRDDLIHALNEHAKKAAGKDLSILYYAGHGVQVEGTNYLIPVNMRADGLSAGYVKLAGISLNAALDYLPAKTRLVFLDACRDNPASRTLVATRSTASAGLAPVNAASGTLVAYATRDGATADDGDGQHSPYTTALLKHLDTEADISLVLRQVRQTVLQITAGRQEPWEYGSLIGDQIVLPLLQR